MNIKIICLLAEEMVSAKDGGLLVLNGDSDEVRSLTTYTSADVPYYGFKDGNDVTAKDIVVDDKGQSFTLVYKGEEMGKLNIKLLENIILANTLAVIAVSLHQGLSSMKLKWFNNFNGMKGRQEIRAGVNGITVIDDFAHHPTACARDFRRYSRTFSLIIEFLQYLNHGQILVEKNV